jgi:hypothetical protein
MFYLSSFFLTYYNKKKRKSSERSEVQCGGGLRGGLDVVVGWLRGEQFIL